MYKYLPVFSRPLVAILLLSIAVVLALFLWQGHRGLSLWDEGFLWYGAQRVMLGEIPMRDFQAYDIGRYYWSAAFMGLLGKHGIVALRVATAFFQAIALFIGLAVLERSSKKQIILFWLLATVTLVAWMAPQYRLFDISLPVMLVGVLAFLVEQPSSRRYFLTGLIVGLVAVFGRNHGIYGAAGSLAVMVYLAVKRENGPSLNAAFAAWAVGVVAGYLPVLVFLAVVPGFALAFWESIYSLFEAKATNLTLPVPWPWLVPFEKLSIADATREVVIGVFFVAIAVFGILSIIWLIRQKMQNKPVAPALVASIVLTLPYVHYAYSRADLSHLAPGIPPFLMGILVLLASWPARIKWPFMLLFCGAGLLVMLPKHSGWYCYNVKQCVEANVAGDRLIVDKLTAGNLEAINYLSAQFAPNGRAFIAAPLWPGAYAAMERKSPMWEIYVTLPGSASIPFQLAEIERIKAANPGFAMIFDVPLNGRDDLRFRNTHQIIDQYIRENFERVEVYAGKPDIQIYKSIQTGR